MRIYIKNVEKPDEYQQVVNTHTTEDIFIPLPGESIFSDYIVTRREWISMEPGQEKVIIWTEPKKEDTIDLVFKKVSGVLKKSGEVLYETKIPRDEYQVVPRVGDEIEIQGGYYKIQGVRKIGDFLKPSKIEFTV